MNTRFEKIFLETVATLDQETLKKKFEPLGRMLGQREKEGLQAALEPLTSATEDENVSEEESDDLIKQLENLNFDQMDNARKEKLIKVLMSKNLPPKTTNNQTEVKKDTKPDSLTYSAPF
jgi:hypothetical protein